MSYQGMRFYSVIGTAFLECFMARDTGCNVKKRRIGNKLKLQINYIEPTRRYTRNSSCNFVKQYYK